jgi:hypothetical protein
LVASGWKPSTAAWFQNRAACSPTNGRPASHDGGGGSRRSARSFAQPVMTSMLPTSVPMAMATGTIRTSSSRTDITVTAAQRWPPRRRCTQRMIGQVATTIMIDQMIAPRKGCRIHRQAKIKPPVKSTPRT